MAALSPPRLFAAWRVEAFFFLCGVPLWWRFQVAIYLCRRLFLLDHVPCRKETAQTQCSRPYDILSCYFHTAKWLGKCQSKLT